MSLFRCKFRFLVSLHQLIAICDVSRLDFRPVLVVPALTASFSIGANSARTPIYRLDFYEMRMRTYFVRVAFARSRTSMLLPSRRYASRHLTMHPQIPCIGVMDPGVPADSTAA